MSVTSMSKNEWFEYAELCGWTLARAHARTGDPAQIAGYLGKSNTFDNFDKTIEQFALEYADQTEKDYVALLKAIRTRRIKMEPEQSP